MKYTNSALETTPNASVDTHHLMNFIDMLTQTRFVRIIPWSDQWLKFGLNCLMVLAGQWYKIMQNGWSR